MSNGMSELPLNRAPEELLPHEDRSRTYSAMRGKRIGGMRALRLQFVPSGGTHNRTLPLSDLRLQDAAKDGTEIILEFSAMTVVLKGRNLAGVDCGIAEGYVAAVEAFDAAKRDVPQDATAAVIDRITFHPKEQARVEPQRPRGRPRLVKAEGEAV